jgi:hypothetical protein
MMYSRHYNAPGVKLTVKDENKVTVAGPLPNIGSTQGQTTERCQEMGRQSWCSRASGVGEDKDYRQGRWLKSQRGRSTRPFPFHKARLRQCPGVLPLGMVSELAWFKTVGEGKPMQY